MGYFSVVQITKSSAKRAFWTLINSGRSLMKIRKRVQLSDEPWGSPSSIVDLDDVVPSNVV